MRIQNLFAKPIDRPIEGVIKADDRESLQIEVEEYVITNEIARNLNILFKAYNSRDVLSNGVWISGFFGSGKSHLLKMLALLLEDTPDIGISVLDTFAEKLSSSEAMLKADMRKAVSIPSKSILFNIDQKADAIAKTQTDAVLSVFSKVFDEFCGYFGQQGYIAHFERDMDQNGIFEAFKEAYQDIANESWYEGRISFNIKRRKIAQAFARVTGNDEEDALHSIKAYRDDYHLSIEDFAERVNDYIQTQEPGFRLNFFVDEVGQYIADNIKLMTNLQTIAESLATRCNGQAWLFVTSQGDMDSVLGQFGKMQANDFSKIQGRFKTKIALNNQDVPEVIQKRLLDKTDDGAILVKNLYHRENKNLATLFKFPDGGQTLKGFRDEEHFVASYPFIPYQYTLFQQAIQSLSQHNMFTGNYQSVGQRSMLGVFQDVVNEIGGEEEGSVASFDQMYEGIRNTLKAGAQGPINIAEQNVDSKFSVRLLKALFLVKYVKSFRSTPRNLRVLMQSSFDQDIDKLHANITEALALLERETYIQRNNDVYEFLTDEEQDIESDIKQVDISIEEVHSYLNDIFFSEILRETKIVLAENQQSYSFTKKIDEKVIGKSNDLTINFITPFSEFTGDVSILTSHSMGKAEMLVVLPPDDRYIRDVQMYLRTDKFVKQNHGVNDKESFNMILNNKAYQNRERKKGVSMHTKELVSQAEFIVSGDRVEINGEDPKTRVINGFNVLVKKVYPNLRMLHGAKYSEDDIRGYLEKSQQSLFGESEAALNEAELEVLQFINNLKMMGEVVTMKKVENRFSANNYGWYLAAIQCITAMLLGRGKVEGWMDGNLLENGPLEKALKNTYGFSNLILQPVKQADPVKMKQLKGFYRDFFNDPPSENEANRLVRAIKTKLRELIATFDGYYAQRHRYPFMTNMIPVIDELKVFAEKNNDYFLERFTDQDVVHWLELKKNNFDPIQVFMTGSKKEIYSDIRTFVDLKHDDLSNADVDELGDILNDPMIFAGNRLQEAKVRLAEMQKAQQEAVDAARKAALENLASLREEMHQHSDFQLLDNDQQAQFDGYFDQIEDTINQQNLAGSIRDRAGTYRTSQYPALMDRISHLAHPPVSPSDPGGEPVPAGPKVTTVHISTLYTVGPKHLMETEVDVAEYIKALKEAMLHAVRNNKRIQR